MEKKTKKLVLAKETLRSLGAKDLERIAGGSGDTQGTVGPNCGGTQHTIIIIQVSSRCNS
jgi:hypothetical protein